MLYISKETSQGQTLMQAAVDNMVNGIVAECGGSCSCAACHCYIDEPWFERIGGLSDIEWEMLDCTISPQLTSRLSCQVTVQDNMDGMVIRLPESQY